MNDSTPFFFPEASSFQGQASVISHLENFNCRPTAWDPGLRISLLHSITSPLKPCKGILNILRMEARFFHEAPPVPAALASLTELLCVHCPAHPSACHPPDRWQTPDSALRSGLGPPCVLTAALYPSLCSRCTCGSLLHCVCRPVNTGRLVHLAASVTCVPGTRLRSAWHKGGSEDSFTG